MRLSTSVKTALAILVLVFLYFAFRTVFQGETEETAEAAEPRPFTVVTETVSPSEWRAELNIGGRTKALQRVIVRAETSGAVEATPVKPGTFVDAGTVLCKLKVDARQSALAEALAALAKAELDHKAASELAAEGFRSETAVAATKAALDLAKARTEQARVQLAKTSIVAPFAGVFDERSTELGDFLDTGDPCGVLIGREPFLIVGAVAEKDVAKISEGDRGLARLATGEEVEGTVRSVARSADPQTRTFEVELEVPNPDGLLRDGVTADFTIFAARRNAHRIPRSALTLDDGGEMGVRTVDASGAVEFLPVRILGEDAGGLWVAGLEGAANLIVRGQDYVKAGQKVAVAAGGGDR